MSDTSEGTVRRRKHEDNREDYDAADEGVVEDLSAEEIAALEQAQLARLDRAGF